MACRAEARANNNNPQHPSGASIRSLDHSGSRIDQLQTAIAALLRPRIQALAANNDCLPSPMPCHNSLVTTKAVMHEGCYAVRVCVCVCVCVCFNIDIFSVPLYKRWLMCATAHMAILLAPAHPTSHWTLAEATFFVLVGTGKVHSITFIGP